MWCTYAHRIILVYPIWFQAGCLLAASMTTSQADIESQYVGDADLYPNLVPMTLKAFLAWILGSLDSYITQYCATIASRASSTDIVHCTYCTYVPTWKTIHRKIHKTHENLLNSFDKYSIECARPLPEKKLTETQVDNPTCILPAGQVIVFSLCLCNYGVRNMDL